MTSRYRKRGPPSRAINTNQLISGRERGRNSARDVMNRIGTKIRTARLTALVIAIRSFMDA